MGDILNLKSWRTLDINLSTLYALPDDTLLTLAHENEHDLLQMICYYFSLNVSPENKLQMLGLLQKLFNILSPKDRTKFVSAGIEIWIRPVIPTIMSLLVLGKTDHVVLEVLEKLCEEIGSVHYKHHLDCWETILENIWHRDKYPKIINNLLISGNPNWHRVWISFIKLLNQDITTTVKCKGTPLNSMLPVVETAFKMDTSNRCRAFLCWNELIDNFSREIGDHSIPRRIKLLMVPLKINNARTKDIAEVKFSTWWELIRKFQPRLENFIKDVVIVFLQYCFGKINSSNTFIPGQLTHELKMKCVEAFIEISGHVYCDGCTTVPKLNGRLICTSCLVSYWSEWTYSMRSAILIIAKDNKPHSKQQIKCIWKSFLLTIGEMPDNNVRRDLVMELLNDLDKLVKECKNCNILADLVFDSMILSSFDEEQKIRQLFKTIGKDHNALKKILLLVVDDSFSEYFSSISPKEVIKRLKPAMEYVLDQSVNSPDHSIQWILKEMPRNDNMLILWTALAMNAMEYNTDICISELCNMLLWPLNNMHHFTDLNLPAISWYTIYTIMYKKISKTKINQQISNILLKSSNTSCLVLCALLAVLKHDIYDKGIKEKVNLLEKLTRDLNDYKNSKELFSILVDTLVILLNYLTSSVNEELAKGVLACTKNVLLGSEVIIQPLVITENLLKSVSELFKIDSYLKHISILGNALQQLLVRNPFNSLVESLVDKILKIPKSSDMTVAADDENHVASKAKNISDKKSFSKPNTPKRSSKKEPSIVNTVVEDGEEYVVVKSNWKFNPRKLTENQKEKLQKKREDIPALYQDLSQSQDEFKNTLWKTDSQDTTNSCKSTKEDISEFNNLKCSEIVPQIMQTIHTTNPINDPRENVEKVSISIPQSKKLTTPTSEKSPRIAFKDRIIKNVKLLLEKTSVEREINTHSVVTTPQFKPRIIKSVNSAPLDRPARVKRIPKKFDDTEIFAMSKKLLCKEQTTSKSTENLLEKGSNENENESDEISLKASDALKTRESDCQTVVENMNCVETFQEHVNDNHEKCMSIEDQTSKLSVNTTLAVDTINDKNIEITEIKSSTQPHECSDVHVAKMTLGSTFPTKDKTANIQSIHESVTLPDVEKNILTSSNEKINSNTDQSNQEELFIANDIFNTDTPTKITNEQVSNDKTEGIKLKTPKDNSQNTDSVIPKSSVKKRKVSRIEKELAIDMVESHILLRSDKRLTRKSLSTNRRTSLADKINKAKLDKIQNSKTPKKPKLKDNENISKLSEDVNVSGNFTDQSQSRTNSEEFSCSEDIIESSQDSTFTTLSVTKKTPIKELIVKVDKVKNIEKYKQKSQEILLDSECQMILDDYEKGNDKETSEQVAVKEVPGSSSKIACDIENSVEILDCDIFPIASNNQSKDDTEISRNKTVFDQNSEIDLTEDMDTEPFEDDPNNEVMLVDNEDVPIAISSVEIHGAETQELAEANTQPVVSQDILVEEVKLCDSGNKINVTDSVNIKSEDKMNRTNTTMMESFDNPVSNVDKNDASSPFKDDTQRKQDFLNNTSEISPIKIVSPDKEKKSPSPENSDYVVIKLSTPVQSNGEPLDNNSPEFFTDDKVSSVRDHSPPRTEMTVINTSPSSSLSLKKNRLQVRSGGRAAQMLGLCVKNQFDSVLNCEKDNEESKKFNNTQARRNLKLLYNIENETNEEAENFLRFKRKLPDLDYSSPTGPILKRKLADIEDETTVSPVGKRKRVSFHDPPVSTTIAVQKYIEPVGIRSPQNSAQKRLERQIRSYTNLKSPKRLDNVFKLDSVLNKAVESFNEDMSNTETQPSLDVTPAIEIVRASELNDKDPICPALVNCNDPIDNIALKLSSKMTKNWLIKELQGKIGTVGDLAKMTELEINRLCIKAPKVKTAKTVLDDYAKVFVTNTNESKDNNDPYERLDAKDIENKIIEPVQGSNEDKNDTTMLEVAVSESKTEMSDIEVQASVVVNDISMQTEINLTDNGSQTCLKTSHKNVQTNESGAKETADIIASCLAERNDFVSELREQLEETSIQQLTEKLPFESLTDCVIQRLSNTNSSHVLKRVLEEQNSLTQSCNSTQNRELEFLLSYMSNKYDANALILFCSNLLKKIHDKHA